MAPYLDPGEWTQSRSWALCGLCWIDRRCLSMPCRASGRVRDSNCQYTALRAKKPLAVSAITRKRPADLLKHSQFDGPESRPIGFWRAAPNVRVGSDEFAKRLCQFI